VALAHILLFGKSMATMGSAACQWGVLRALLEPG
jgi:hypothetical protein